jgi:anti-anti-sigma regulatory factor
MEVDELNEVTVIGIVNEECQFLIRTVDPLLAKGRRSFVFNMAQATFLNSVNIAAIIATRNKIVAAHGKVTVCNLTANIKSVFRILQLERWFDLELDLAEALLAAR